MWSLGVFTDPTVLAALAAIASAAAAAVSCVAAWRAAAQVDRNAKLAEDRKEGAQRSAIAGAILGELEAYIELLDIQKTQSAFRSLAASPDLADLKRRLATFPTLPSGHPVFDRCADQIGLLPADLPREISKLYNMITGGRLLMSNLAGPGMANAPDGVPQGALLQLMLILDRGREIADAVLPALREIAFQRRPR